MVEILAVQFFSLNLEPESSFHNNWLGEGWFTLIDAELHDRNFFMVCFEKASCWDQDKNHHNFIGLNGTKCKSVLRIVTKADFNIIPCKMPQLSTGMLFLLGSVLEIQPSEKCFFQFVVMIISCQLLIQQLIKIL